MKKIAVIAIVILMLATIQISFAADLQAGWYAKLFGISAWGFNPSIGRLVGTDWKFTGDLGTVGPFNITSPDPLWAERMVSVPITTENVTAGTSVYLWGNPVQALNVPITVFSVGYDTNYDASQMQLQLLMYKEGAGFSLLWSETRSGLHQAWPNLLSESQSIPVGYVPVFRVEAVPEPSSLFIILTGIGLAGFRIRRKYL